jgi:hypothetical protein
MVSKPGAYSTASMFDDRPPGSPAVVPPPELPPVTAEESATLGGARDLDEDDPATAVYQPGRSPWSQQTIEVPLEMRAQAGVSAQTDAEPLFEEVFDEPEPAPPPPFAAAVPPPLPVMAEEPEEVFDEALEDLPPQDWAPPPSPASPPSPPPAPAPAMSSPPPATSAAPAVPSFADLTPAEPEPEPAAPASQAAEVAVPQDMVEKIAQRVVAQISEKVVREVAWEVIPDLAEALIKKEIERLKAELQRT